MAVIDKSDNNIQIYFKTNGYLKEFNSAYQNIKIVNTNEFGNTLFLDDSLQSTEKDEYIYHEAMAHSLLSNIPSASRVLILGGSEGYLAREILKWPNICRIDQVDWDEDLVNHYVSLGNYSDMRIQVYHEDALIFLRNNLETYDAIFVDLIDPCEESLGFFKDLLLLALSSLSSGGGIIANVGSVSPLKKGCADKLAEWLKDKIMNRKALCIHVPSFMQAWCLLMGSKSLEETSYLPQTRFFDQDTVLSISRWSKDYSEELRFFNQ